MNEERCVCEVVDENGIQTDALMYNTITGIYFIQAKPEHYSSGLSFAYSVIIAFSDMCNKNKNLKFISHDPAICTNYQEQVKNYCRECKPL
jgi:hypothetical protein